MTIHEIRATVRMNDGRILSNWWPVASLSEGGFHFEVDLGDCDLHRCKVLVIPFDIRETDAHPDRGSEYRILQREALESEGEHADSYHLLPPDGIPGSDGDTIAESNPLPILQDEGLA